MAPNHQVETLLKNYIYITYLIMVIGGNGARDLADQTSITLWYLLAALPLNNTRWKHIRWNLKLLYYSLYTEMDL